MCAFFTSKIPAKKRIGPHNFDVLCFFYGAMLADAHAEKHGNGTRISFHQRRKQVSFLYYIQTFLALRGYCTQKKRKISTSIGKHGKLYYSIKFHTFTFQSLNWIHEEFYANGKKIVPRSVQEY